MHGSPENQHPFAVAMEWVAKITTVALEMVLPGILGSWLDQKWGTGFLALVGFGLGVSVAIWHLIVMTRIPPRTPKSGTHDDSSASDE